MSRQMEKGTGFESFMTQDLAESLDDDRIERRAKCGTKDRGDVSGVRFRGRRFVLEMKNCKRMELAAWVDEAEVEAGNDDAPFFAVVHKRKGRGKADAQYVTMPWGVFKAMLALDPGVLHEEAARAFDGFMGHPMEQIEEMGVTDGN